MSELEQIYCCALRYALGRQTYITSVVSDFLCNKMPELSVKCKSIMIKDIEECEDYGHDCDKKSWMKLLAKLTK